MNSAGKRKKTLDNISSPPPPPTKKQYRNNSEEEEEEDIEIEEYDSDYIVEEDDDTVIDDDIDDDLEQEEEQEEEEEEEEEEEDDNNDCYETMPFDVQLMLEQFCCKEHDTILDPFVCDAGFSQQFMQCLGYKVAATNSRERFNYEQPSPSVSMITTNPPFSQKQRVLQRFVEFNLPFVLILPSDVIQRDYFTNVVRKSAATHQWQVVVPNKTLSYHRCGIVQPLAKFKSSFFVCRPRNEQQTNCLRCQQIRNDAAASNEQRGISSVQIRLLDYDTMRKNAGLLVGNRSFHIVGPNIGKQI